MKILLKNATYMDSDLSFKEADIYINNGIIDTIKKDIELSLSNLKIIDCSDLIVLPGLINGHTHNPATIARGLFKDCPLDKWCSDSIQGQLQNKVFDFIDNVNDKDFHILLLKAYSEYLKQGVTFIVESGQADNAELKQKKAMEEIGLQGIIDAFEEIENVYEKSNDKISFSAHLPEEEDICASEIENCIKIKDKTNTFRMTHCMETKHRVNIIKNLANKSSVKYFYENGLLDKKTILFHLVYADVEDIKLLKNLDVSAVHCPVSNAWSGAGLAKIEKWLKEDINILLGSDFLLSDIWEVMRKTYYYLKTVSDISEYKVEDIFKMVSVNGAKAFMKENKKGVIKKGADADLIFFDKNNPKLWPLINKKEFSNILYNILINGNENIIKHVLVKGSWVIRNYKLQTINEDYINLEYKRIIKNLYYND